MFFRLKSVLPVSLFSYNERVCVVEKGQGTKQNPSFSFFSFWMAGLYLLKLRNPGLKLAEANLKPQDSTDEVHTYMLVYVDISTWCIFTLLVFFCSAYAQRASILHIFCETNVHHLTCYAIDSQLFVFYFSSFSVM